MSVPRLPLAASGGSPLFWLAMFVFTAAFTAVGWRKLQTAQAEGQERDATRIRTYLWVLAGWMLISAARLLTGVY